ncbi:MULTISPECIES: D-2-hydroxyacid dehydrogenase [Paenibacillus]|jgi:glycerate dehydrogenase|uniref:D-2-hydroxyacid dehydrogenase n=1 Tax=Paenibacillus oceani TaxID=2772510 RepID=A0A927CDK1_9BACL|nr:D-2-hydroxyacid dehydrogenase [Paenibacillus oceani]MBD2864867.1 D-2-hydroxyacid dehydrogenase [Paenibacillus oceani]MDF2659823.1 D-2-hydroxyacid dehydrogenase [Paenibacillus sp.]
MNIIVLDGYTLNPGDLSWEGLEALGTVTVYDRTPAESIVERAKGARVILTNKTPLRAEVLKQLPELQYIGVLATGYDVVDTAEAAKLGITVTNVPAYSTASVAQLVFALLLELCQQAGLHNEAVRKGEWAGCPDFSFWKTPLVELAGKTLGVVGIGGIGEKVAEIGQAFGMNVIATNRSGKRPALEGVRLVSIGELFQEADVVTLHCPLTPETEGLIQKATLLQMKKTAFLINTGRGKLIRESDLADALNEGVIAGAGLDVLSSEPPAANNPLLSARNCIITPHVGWASFEARGRLMDVAVSNVAAFAAGSPVHVVNRL